MGGLSNEPIPDTPTPEPGVESPPFKMQPRGWLAEKCQESTLENTFAVCEVISSTASRLHAPGLETPNERS